MKRKFFWSIILSCLFAPALFSQECLECHKKTTPNIVSDWLESKHSKNDVSCSICHGEDHKSAEDFAKAKIPTPETCAACHEDKVNAFKRGKHAFAWAAMKAMPTRIMRSGTAGAK